MKAPRQVIKLRAARDHARSEVKRINMTGEVFIPGCTAQFWEKAADALAGHYRKAMVSPK